MRRGVKQGVSPFKAGALALVFVAAFTYLGFTKFRIPFKAQYEINAVFPPAGTEIKSGSPVRIAGVEVGKLGAATVSADEVLEAHDLHLAGS